jgi:hypothetical protein
MRRNEENPPLLKPRTIKKQVSQRLKDIEKFQSQNRIDRNTLQQYKNMVDIQKDIDLIKRSRKSQFQRKPIEAIGLGFKILMGLLAALGLSKADIQVRPHETPAAVQQVNEPVVATLRNDDIYDLIFQHNAYGVYHTYLVDVHTGIDPASAKASAIQMLEPFKSQAEKTQSELLKLRRLKIVEDVRALLNKALPHAV